MDDRVVERLQRARKAGEGEIPGAAKGAAKADFDSDPQTKRAWRNAERVSIIGIFVILLGAALIYTRAVAVPIVAAILIGTMIGLLGETLSKHRVPPIVAAIVALGLFLAVTYGAIAAFSAPLTSWIDRSPEVGARLHDRISVLQEPLKALRGIQDSLRSLTGDDKAAIPVDVRQSSLAQSIFEVATPAFSQLFLFVGTLVFFIAGRAHLKQKLVVAFPTREARLTALRILTDIERNLAAYLATVTTINAGLGVACALAMWAIGMPNPALWGVLVFTMNFIPFIGPLLMAIVFLGVGFMSFETLPLSLLPAALFLVLHGIETSFVTPGIVGRRLTMNPLLVFLSLAFWTWVWGPAGAFMAVPLLVVALVVSEHLISRDEVKLPG